MKAARILFVDQEGFGPTQCQGTKVVLEDGSELPNVRKIVLTATVNGVWEAEITVGVSLIGEVGAAIDVTDLSDDAFRFAPAVGNEP